MKNEKLTDEQIIEIFEYCNESDYDDCFKCIADKLTKDNITIYRVKNIIRIDIKE